MKHIYLISSNNVFVSMKSNYQTEIRFYYNNIERHSLIIDKPNRFNTKEFLKYEQILDYNKKNKCRTIIKISDVKLSLQFPHVLNNVLFDYNNHNHFLYTINHEKL